MPDIPDSKHFADTDIASAKAAMAQSKLAMEAAAKVLATHKVAAGESLSAIAQKYYGSGAKEKWMAIYAANKALIGDNPAALKVGQELKIPKLD